MKNKRGINWKKVGEWTFSWGLIILTLVLALFFGRRGLFLGFFFMVISALVFSTIRFIENNNKKPKFETKLFILIMSTSLYLLILIYNCLFLIELDPLIFLTLIFFLTYNFFHTALLGIMGERISIGRFSPLFTKAQSFRAGIFYMIIAIALMIYSFNL